MDNMRQEQPINIKKLSRQERGKLIFENTNIEKTSYGWKVPSQTGNGYYVVKFRGMNHRPECECPDCKLRRKKCKHIHAVELYLKWEIGQEGKITQTRGVKVTYSQKWKAYDNAQTNEKLVFIKLLKDLCENVEQPKYKFGRPKIPLSDMVFSSVMKIYTTFSLRRFMSDIKIAKEMKMIDSVPCFASIGHFLQDKKVTKILKKLIFISASPLKSVETDFTADSSGFSTSRFARYFSYKHQKDLRYRIWIKAHLISGVKTNIVTGVEITEGKAADSPQLNSLIEQTNKRFDMSEVSCDKAYSSRNNLKLIQDVGAVPYIPFKKNSTPQVKGTVIWERMWYYFMYKRDEYLQHYHKRSNSETVFHMIKTKFGDSLRSKTITAQINELLCKVLCHNICVVIQEMNELGIRGEFVVEEKR